MRPPAPSLDVIAARNAASAAAATAAAGATSAADGTSAAEGPTPTIPMAEDPRDSRSSSSTSSPAPADNEESDFFLGNNDSQSSLGVVPNMQDMQVNDTECLPTVASLPSEILISIFSRVSNSKDLFQCMLTCKRWARNVVEILWHRPTCTTWDKHGIICRTLGLQQPFFAYPDFIKRLNLAAIAEEVNDGSVLPLSVCTRVERLTLTNCKNLTDSGLIPLVSNSQHLLALDVSGDVGITEASILAIAQSCRKLQGLNVSNCKQISNESMVQLAESCRFIKRLKLNDCDQLNDLAVLAFANNCPNILEIDLHQCFNIGNEPVTALLAKGQSLRELRLAHCELVEDTAFLSLPPPKTYEHLRILDLTSCTRLTDRAIEKIIDVAPRLRNLVLAKCNNITDAAVYAISRLSKNLHYVHLGHCRNITDDAVKRLVQCCNRIRYIDLGCCIHLTDESITRLAWLPKLKRIGLVKCANITDESLFALAKANNKTHPRRDASNNIIPGSEFRASSLERVHLSYCTNLTLPSIIRLLNCCPKLTHLSLTGVPAFLRNDLESFCREAPVDFTEHQRAVFCVFSGQGVTGLRRYFNTKEEFAEYHEHRRDRGRRAPGTAGGTAADGPEPDTERFEEGEDDDMGDGSEVALLDGPQPTTHTPVDAADMGIPPPPPPPPPPPAPLAGFAAPSFGLEGPAHPQATLSTVSEDTMTDELPPVPTTASAAPTNQHAASLNGSNVAGSASLEQLALDSTAPHAPSASTAGAGIFGNQGLAPGPSTAPLQSRVNDGEDGGMST
ncbi:hypothetical protein GGR56DRAFT_120021 [Xylariaceae sp. FL0804]|nr:hypothetical protein GGR56DRAFT_120021 [Xylariaceae sp. FL0804]